MTQNSWNSPTLESVGDGKILIGSGSGRPAAALITGDSSVDITPGANSLQVDNNAIVGDFIKISTATASSSATISFTDLSSTYFLYILRYNDLAPATDQVNLIMRTSTDNGATYDSGASDYAWSIMYLDNSGNENGVEDQSDSAMNIIGGAYGGTVKLGNATNENGSGTIYIYNPSAVKYTFINSESFYLSESGSIKTMWSSAVRKSAADVDAFQFSMTTGNIASGSFTLYGVKNA